MEKFTVSQNFALFQLSSFKEMMTLRMYSKLESLRQLDVSLHDTLDKKAASLTETPELEPTDRSEDDSRLWFQCLIVSGFSQNCPTTASWSSTVGADE